MSGSRINLVKGVRRSDLYHWINVNKKEVDITLLCSIIYDESACSVRIATDGVI